MRSMSLGTETITLGIVQDHGSMGFMSQGNLIRETHKLVSGEFPNAIVEGLVIKIPVTVGQESLSVRKRVEELVSPSIKVTTCSSGIAIRKRSGGTEQH